MGNKYKAFKLMKLIILIGYNMILNLSSFMNTLKSVLWHKKRPVFLDLWTLRLWCVDIGHLRLDS